jgi:hypothetical protein
VIFPRGRVSSAVLAFSVLLAALSLFSLTSIRRAL